MPIEILMPALSPTMTEGNLARWVKKEGDAIKPGQVIAEIETDKATMEVEAVDEGVLGKIIVAEGTQNVAVNQVIAVLLTEGETPAAITKDYKAAVPAAKPTEAPKSATPTQAPVAAPIAPKAAPAPKPAPKPAAAPVAASSDGRVVASPLAKRLAAEKGIDLSLVEGHGPKGRVVRADVEYAVRKGVGGAAVRRNPSEYTAVTNDNMRRVIARRLLESKQTVPHFYLSIDCMLDKLLDVRKDVNDAAPKRADGNPAYKLSVNDMIIKASALALKKVPAANATWTDAAILLYNNVDVSVAVALEGGLITPIIRNADQKDLPSISSEMKDLAARARKGALAPEEFQGGGFSLSNLGMYGVKHFNAIVNPPQGCILAIGAGEERAVVVDGSVKVANVMTVSLSCDHRVVDGAVGAQFLAAFKDYIEKPATLLLG